MQPLTQVKGNHQRLNTYSPPCQWCFGRCCLLLLLPVSVPCQPVLTLEVWWEACCELPEVAQLLAQIQLGAIKQHRQDGLCGTGVVNNLVGKKHLARIRAGVDGSIILLVTPLEQEYQAIHRPATCSICIASWMRLSCRHRPQNSARNGVASRAWKLKLRQVWLRRGTSPICSPAALAAAAVAVQAVPSGCG